jgi:hypothetical protein
MSFEEQKEWRKFQSFFFWACLIGAALLLYILSFTSIKPSPVVTALCGLLIAALVVMALWVRQANPWD